MHSVSFCLIHWLLFIPVVTDVMLTLAVDAQGLLTVAELFTSCFVPFCLISPSHTTQINEIDIL